MIRIIAGKYKGRFLKVPDSKATRPTMDKVKQALFSAIKDKPINSVCLDLFAGSGSLGIEALSRGAKKVYFIDKNVKTFKTLKENVTSIESDESKYEVLCTDYRLFLKKQHDLKFDLIFLDPPYRYDINQKIIAYLASFKLLNTDCIIVSEQDNKNIEIPNFSLKDYRYGEKYVGLYTWRNI